MVGGQARNGRDLYRMMVQFTASEGYDEGTVAGWLNDALSDFPDIAFRPLREEYVDILANTEYSLPVDFSSIVGWLYQGKDYKYRERIRITADDYVIFPYDLTHTITLMYNKARQPYDNLDAELPIRKPLRMILYDYLLWKFYDSDGEGDLESERLAQRYESRFEQRKQVAMLNLENREVSEPYVTEDHLPKPSRYHHTMLEEEDDF